MSESVAMPTMSRSHFSWPSLQAESFFFQDRLDQFPADTRATEIFVRIRATGLFWIDDGERGRHFGWRRVMVGDDDIHSIFIREFDRTDIGDATVEGNEQFCAIVRDLLYRVIIQTESFIMAMRDIVVKVLIAYAV